MEQPTNTRLYFNGRPTRVKAGDVICFDDKKYTITITRRTRMGEQTLLWTNKERTYTSNVGSLVTMHKSVFASFIRQVATMLGLGFQKKDAEGFQYIFTK